MLQISSSLNKSYINSTDPIILFIFRFHQLNLKALRHFFLTRDIC